MYFPITQGKMDITNKILATNKEGDVLNVIQNKDRKCSLRKLISELNADHKETKVEKKTKRLSLADKNTKED